MNNQPWSGDRQRAELRGFSRLRAILWRRSLHLYEWWTLHQESWPSPLRQELDRVFADIDLDDPRRCHAPSCAFGETPIVTTVKLLELVRAEIGRDLPVFLDLGCGRGMPCLVAAHLGYRGVGYELDERMVRRSNEAAQNLGVDAAFYDGDFLLHKWPSPALIYVTATAYPESVREALLECFKECRESYFLVVDWELPGPFRALWSGVFPVGWGTASFALYAPPDGL